MKTYRSQGETSRHAAKKVLIVDDSPTVLAYLKQVIESRDGLEVVGTARDGQEALEMVRASQPDIVTMDIHMPRMNGLEATRKIMEECPVPIVIVSASFDQDQVRNTFRAIEAGALAALERPPGPGHPESTDLVEKLIQTLKTMSEVRVVRRYWKHQEKPKPSSRAAASVFHTPDRSRIEVVAIGASTGGPPVIRTILCGLDQGFPVPILVVQHIAVGFLEGMVEWLNRECHLSVVIPANGEKTRGGHVYFAPEGWHMGINGNGKIVLSDAPAENGLKPAVSYLFRTVEKAYGPRALGMLLTGMGKDGALELKAMRERGATTIAQSRETCVVYGMPAEAVKSGAAGHVLSPEQMVSFLHSLFGQDRVHSSIR